MSIPESWRDVKAEPAAAQTESWREVEAEPAAAQTDSVASSPWRSRIALLLFAAAAAAALALGTAALLLGGASPTITLPADALAGDQAPSSTTPGSTSHPEVASRPTLGTVVVDVAGAVRQPGLYRLPAGSRVGDAISVAGGFGPTVDAAAAATQLNLAERLEDGGKVLVPARGSGASPPSAASHVAGSAGEGSGGTGGGRIDLNRAAAGELDTLPGIGPATAAKIIASRQGQPFRAVDDLLTRKLVRQSVFDGLRDLVFVGG